MRKPSRFVYLPGFLLLGLCSPAPSQSPAQDLFTVLYEVSSEPGYNPIGTMVAGGGDYNGDGFDDFAIGSPLRNYAVGSVRVYSGIGRTVIGEYDGNPAYNIPPPFCLLPANCGERLATTVAFVDLNDDGVAELAVGAPSASTWWNGVFYALGRVVVASQYSSAPVLEYIPTINGTGFGSLVSSGGDVDADGFSDLLVSSIGYDIPGAGFSNSGAAWVLSGPVLGSVLYFVPGVQPGEHFGGSIASGGLTGIGDVDGDGHADWAVASPSRDNGALQSAGAVFVFSGESGSILLQWFGTAQDQFLGSRIAPLDDVNGDGVPDLAFSDNPLAPFNLSPQNLFVASGATGAYLYILSRPTAFGYIKNLASMNDADGDGVREIVVPDVTSVYPFDHRIQVLSGANGTQLFQDTCAACTTGLANFVAGAGDLNGDGLGDFLVDSDGAPVAGTSLVGKVLVYAARSLNVIGAPVVGGTLNLALNVPKWPSHPYVLAFSMGNAGFVAAGYWVPLAPDALFFDSLNASMTGTLDAAGQGAASFPIPNLPALHGFTFYASAAVLNPGPIPGIRSILPAAEISIP